MNVNIEVMANTIEKELGKSLNMVSIQALDNAIQKAHWRLDTQRELRAVLYQRKYRSVKTYADYIGMVSKV